MSCAPPTVSVVLLSYNRPGYLRQALASVLAQSYPNVEVIVVDNQSPASREIAEMVSRHPEVKLIRNGVNVGYAGGMNRGVEGAAGFYTYLTEDDIVLDTDCIRHLVEYMGAHPSTALAAPVVYNRGEGTVRCAGVQIVLGGVYRKRVYGAGERDAGQFREPFEVGCLDGAALFARTSFLHGLGGFREEFFMYVESSELCLRVKGAGGRLAVVPGAKAYHFEPPAEAPPQPELEFHKLKNLFALYVLHAPARVLPEFFCRYALLAALRSAAGRGARPATLARALLWLARRAPALVRDRFAGPALKKRGGDGGREYERALSS